VEEKLVYPWFHKRHKELVSQLADTLKAMKAEGTFQELIEKAKQKNEILFTPFSQDKTIVAI